MFSFVVRTLKKDKKEDSAKELKKEKRVIDDKDRHKPYGKTAWTPVDDVYIMRFYPRTIYDAANAIDMLKKFQQLDFTSHNQPVYIDLKLDMKLEKKVTASAQLFVFHVSEVMFAVCSKWSSGHLLGRTRF